VDAKCPLYESILFSIALNHVRKGEKKMKDYYKNNAGTFSAIEDAEIFFTGTRHKTEKKMILWSVSILSWIFFLAGAAVSILRIYYPDCI
jgi:hypothetical protein